MYLRSRRRRERDRRCAILQAQAKSYVLKRIHWHRPRDDRGCGELEASSTSAAPSCYTSSNLSEPVKLKGNTFDTALSYSTSSKLSETVYLNVDSETGSLEWVGSGWACV